MKLFGSFSHKAAALLGVAVLAISVVATPFDFELDEAPNALRRAIGGKYVGSKCTTNSECYSENCAPTNGTSTLTCQRQPERGPCFKNANCQSWNCVGQTGSKKCAYISKLYGKCVNNIPSCADGLACSSPVSGICLYPLDSTCKYNKQCLSRTCTNGVCTASALPPYKDCTQDSQCLSGSCIPTNRANACQNPDGSYSPCPQSYNHCAGYPLGHTCATQSECARGFCTNGVCVAGKDGDSCTIDRECPESGFCLSGKCKTPPAASVWPNDLCGADSQCRSGDCVGALDIVEKDSQGVNIGHDAAPGINYNKRYSKSYGVTSVCNYIGENKACRSLFDCDKQLCKGGVCLYGEIGDRCTINYQCKSKVCSLQGKCIDPAPGTVGVHQPAATQDQCYSGFLAYTPQSGIYRPSLQDPTKLAKEFDFACFAAFAGGKCKANRDCQSEKCQNGICQEGTGDGYSPYPGGR